MAKKSTKSETAKEGPKLSPEEIQAKELLDKEAAKRAEAERVAKLSDQEKAAEAQERADHLNQLAKEARAKAAEEAAKPSPQNLPENDDTEVMKTGDYIAYYPDKGGWFLDKSPGANCTPEKTLVSICLVDLRYDKTAGAKYKAVKHKPIKRWFKDPKRNQQIASDNAIEQTIKKLAS